MTPTDDRLRALFAADEPPASDRVFAAAVTERLVRRRWLQDLAFLGGLSALGAVALWALWPVLQPAVVTIARNLASSALGLALAFCAVAMLGGLGHEAPVAES